MITSRTITVHRDQAVWERETFFVEVPEGLSAENLVDFVSEYMAAHEADHVSVLCDVEHMDPDLTFEDETGREIRLHA